MSAKHDDKRKTCDEFNPKTVNRYGFSKSKKEKRHKIIRLGPFLDLSRLFIDEFFWAFNTFPNLVQLFLDLIC